MAPHSSTLAWKIPWMEEPGGLQSMGSLRVGHDWATSLSLFTLKHWRRKCQPTQCSCLENPTDRGAWWATVHGVARVGHDWATKPPSPLPYSNNMWLFVYLLFNRIFFKRRSRIRKADNAGCRQRAVRIAHLHRPRRPSLHSDDRHIHMSCHTPCCLPAGSKCTCHIHTYLQNTQGKHAH